jgi:hypothetical protein
VGGLFELVECREVDELEAVVDGGVCVFVWCKAMNEDSVLGRRLCGREVLMVVIDILKEGGDAGVAAFLMGW